MKRLTRNMEVWLVDLLNGENPWGRVHGQSQHGGFSKVVDGLCVRGLLDARGQLTKAGRRKAEELRQEKPPVRRSKRV